MTHFHDEAEHDHIPFTFEGAPGDGSRIVVTAAKRRWLAERWALQWRRPPTTDQLHALVQDFVREEVFYREALGLGLDRNDLIVRRRLVQKMETLALGDDGPYGNAQVMAYFLLHQERYRVPERVFFSHVFFSSAIRGEHARPDARIALSELIGSRVIDVSGLGDVPITPSPVRNSTRREVADRFGGEFADSLFALESGAWSGPIASAHGRHVVLVTARAERRLPELEEVAGRVAADLDIERRVGALNALYERVRPKYEVVVEDDKEMGA